MEEIQPVMYIKYKKEEYPVRLSYKAMKALKTELKDINVKDIASMDPEVLEKMLWHGLVSGHSYEDKELTLKKEQMEDVLDYCLREFMKVVVAFFPKAAATGNELPDQVVVTDIQKKDPETVVSQANQVFEKIVENG